jgi:predicted HTH domain antitoxin
LTLGQAAHLADLPQIEFQRVLASRNIPLHYGVESMEQDVQRATRLSGA